MRDLHFTAHALSRLGQRGFRASDAEIAALFGIEVKDGLLLMRRQCEAAARNLRRLADQVIRLPGTYFVTDRGAVVTVYRTKERKQRRLLRTAEERNLED